MKDEDDEEDAEADAEAEEDAKEWPATEKAPPPNVFKNPGKPEVLDKTVSHGSFRKKDLTQFISSDYYQVNTEKTLLISICWITR